MLSPPRLRPSGAQTGAGLRLNLLETSPWVLEGAGTLFPEPWGSSVLSFLQSCAPPPLAERSSEMPSAARSRCGQGPDRQTATSPRRRAQPAPRFAGCWLPACFGAGPGLSPPLPAAALVCKEEGEARGSVRLARSRQTTRTGAALRGSAPPSREHGSGPPPPPTPPVQEVCSPPGSVWVPPPRLRAGCCAGFSSRATATGGEAVAPPCPSRPWGTQLGGG